MTLQSPCVKICTLDSAARYCTGCGRTLAEIARWSSFSDAERAEVMRILSERLAQGTKTGT